MAKAAAYVFSERLVDFVSPVKFDASLLEQLDMFKFGNAFLKGFSREEIEAWFGKYLTYDTNEISRRQKLFRAFEKIEGAAELLRDLLGRARRITLCAEAIGRGGNHLQRCVWRINALRLYTESVSALCEKIRSSNDDAFKNLTKALSSLMETEDFRRSVARVAEVSEYLPTIKNVGLAVNVTSSGDAVQLGLAGINRWSEPAAGFLSGAESPNSLTASSQMHGIGENIFLQAHLQERIEIALAIPVARATAALRNASLQSALNWVEFISPAELYIAALDYAAAFKAKGVAVCDPNPGAAELEFDSLYYPHMSLSQQQLPVPYAAALKKSGLTIITGANHSGKTSFLKATAQSCFLAQTGLPAPAASFSFSPFQRYMMLDAPGEDDKMRLSRFQIEAKTVKAMQAEADSSTLLLLNEPFTSTNPDEGAAVLCDVLRQLLDKKVTVALVTHLYDVFFTLEEEGRADMRSYVTQSELAPDGINFLYEVCESRPDGVSYARIIARQYGLMADLLLKSRDDARTVTDFLSEVV